MADVIVMPAEYYNAQYNVKVVAVNASTKLDYPGVKTTCDDVLETAKTGMKKISKDISSVKLGKDVMTVKDKSIEPTVEELNAFLNELPEKGISPTLEDIKERTLTEYNKLQERLNEEALEEFNIKVKQEMAKQSLQ